MLKALNVRDIAKNAINAFVGAATYKYTKQQILERTTHEPDDITVKVSATVAGSTAHMLTSKHSDAYVDKIADWYAARKTAKQTPEVPTES